MIFLKIGYFKQNVAVSVGTVAPLCLFILVSFIASGCWAFISKLKGVQLLFNSALFYEQFVLGMRIVNRCLSPFL